MAELDFIVETTKQAGAVLKDFFGKDLEIQTKKDKSLVTNADLAAEKVILDQIKKHHPNDLILSEEAGLSDNDRSTGRSVWIIDPLDGTANFSNSYPLFCVSIGYGKIDEEGKIKITKGAIDAPIMDKTYAAEAGKGCFCNDRQVKVAPERDVERSFLVTGFYYDSGTSLKKNVANFARIADKCVNIRRDGTAALDLAMVAEGIFDGFWEVGLQPWDVAAGSLMVEEAGGRVVNYYELDKPFDIENRTIITGTSRCVNQLYEMID